MRRARLQSQEQDFRGRRTGMKGPDRTSDPAENSTQVQGDSRAEGQEAHGQGPHRAPAPCRGEAQGRAKPRRAAHPQGTGSEVKMPVLAEKVG